MQTARALSDRIGESVAGAAEIRGNDTFHLETRRHQRPARHDLRASASTSTSASSSSSSSTTSSAQITPFFFYSVGGYLVIQGRATQAVARRAGRRARRLQGHPRSVEGAAHLVFDQGGRADQVRADRLAVRAAGTRSTRKLMEEPPAARSRRSPARSRPPASIYAEDGGINRVDRVSFTIPAGEHVALRRRRTQRQGRHHASARAPRLPERRPHRRRRASTSPTCTRRFRDGASPTRPRTRTSSRDRCRTISTTASCISRCGRRRTTRRARKREQTRVRDALIAGNSPDDIRADWIDYEAAGVADAAALTEAALAVLRRVEMEQEVIGFGLASAVGSAGRTRRSRRWASRRARGSGTACKAKDLTSFVELFDRDALPLEHQRRGEPAVRHAAQPGVPAGQPARQSGVRRACCARSGCSTTSTPRA